VGGWTWHCCHRIRPGEGAVFSRHLRGRCNQASGIGTLVSGLHPTQVAEPAEPAVAAFFSKLLTKPLAAGSSPGAGSESPFVAMLPRHA
jgi:hypothetical protein